MKGLRALSALAVVGCAGIAGASIFTIGPFVGDYFEGFEGPEIPKHQFLPSYNVFQGNAVVNQVGAGQGLHVTTGWGFFHTIFPHGGQYFMGGAGVNAEWVFDVPALQFGGYFGTNANVPGATAHFYDEGGGLMGTLPVTAPLGSWAWNGWETTDPGGIKRVQIIANNAYSGFIMHDDMQYTLIPAPSALALLGLGTLALRRRR